MSVRLVGCVFVAAVLASPGCITAQDLGSHAASNEGGAVNPFPPAGDGSSPFPGPAEKIVFVTDGLFTADLAMEGGAASGLQGGDNLCNTEARDAGLGGTFRAWLSTSTENARDRIAAVGPWRMVKGPDVLFPDRSAGGTPKGFLQYTAKGNDLFFTNESNVWTGTKDTGTVNVATCAGWTSGLASQTGTYGQFTWTSGFWTDYRGFEAAGLSKPCSTRLRLYCFEQ